VEVALSRQSITEPHDHDKPTDFEIVHFRIINPAFDHAQTNDAVKALERIQHRLALLEAVHG
jgi:hypothetical protein